MTDYIILAAAILALVVVLALVVRLKRVIRQAESLAALFDALDPSARGVPLPPHIDKHGFVLRQIRRGRVR